MLNVGHKQPVFLYSYSLLNTGYSLLHRPLAICGCPQLIPSWMNRGESLLNLLSDQYPLATSLRIDELWIIEQSANHSGR